MKERALHRDVDVRKEHTLHPDLTVSKHHQYFNNVQVFISFLFWPSVVIPFTSTFLEVL